MGDLIVYLSDISLSDESRGAEVRITMQNEAIMEYIDDAALAEAAQEKTDSSATLAPQENANSKQTVIHSANRAYPFTLNITVTSPCLLRYKIDRQESREEYLKAGEVVNMNPKQLGVRIWVSNSNALKIQLIADTKSYDIEPGKAGEVDVEDIKWVKNKDGRYAIVIEKID